ncbi:MAG: hypothetical protein SGPRY_013666, partial [Prymnesium sp.]
VDSAEQQKRFKRTAALQEIYMGQWEVSNEAVNIAMTELRNLDDAGAGDIMKCLESDAEDLSTRLLANGINVGQMLQLSLVIPDEISGGSGEDKLATLQSQKNKAEEEAARLLKEKMALEQEMAALKARVKQLEASHRAGAVAAVRIGALQKQLKSAKENGGEAADGSKACLIS